MSSVNVERSSDRAAWAIPAGALTAWLRLKALGDEIGAVPCRTSDPEAWWPDRSEVDGYEARAAIAACEACPARQPCLDYAIAADEPGGIWGGLLPAERRELVDPAAAA